MNKQIRPSIDEKEMYYYYYKKNISTSVIARHYGRSRDTVRKHIKLVKKKLQDNKLSR